MSAAFRIPRSILERTFEYFRECGQGQRECQMLWIGPWATPGTVTEAVHPKHDAHLGGFALNDRWLNDFWIRLGHDNMGIRVQVHTHPGAAFHSKTDDEFPIIHKQGFLSLVIPNFGLGAVGFANAFLAEIQPDGAWREVAISSRLVIE